MTPAWAHGPAVADAGSREARLLLIGEAPGETEVLEGRPFVGASGKRLDVWLAKAGLSREHVYITNVVPWRPPGNKLAGAGIAAFVRECARRVQALIAEMPNLTLIVPLGNTALHALGIEKPITHVLGTPLAYRCPVRQRTTKVIPCVHPAATFRQPALAPVAEGVWQKIAHEVRFPEIWAPAVQVHVVRSDTDPAWAFVEADARTPLALDIETPLFGGKSGQRRIGCVGLAQSADRAVVVVLRDESGAPLASTARLRALLEGPRPKIAQNGLFDAAWLKHAEGIHVQRFVYDTRWMHHALDARAPHDLNTLAALYTRRPYWKDECKDHATGARYAANNASLWEYCGLDVTATWEVAMALRAELRRLRRLGFYMRCYGRQLPALLHMMLHGVRVDEAALAAYVQEHIAAHSQAMGRIRAAGWGEILTPNGVSATRLREGLKARKVRVPTTRRPDGRISPTTNELALRRLAARHPEHAEALQAVLAVRDHAKLLEFAQPKLFDTDGRLRCTFGFGTETGRLSSSGTPWDTGRNLQNIPPAARQFIVAEPRQVLVSIDLSQIESRLCYMFAGGERLRTIANSDPAAVDMHTENASLIFGVPPEAVTKKQRDLGKRAVHGAQRGMQAKRLRETLILQGFEPPPLEECEAVLQAYHRAVPELASWHRAVRIAMMRDRVLYTPAPWRRALLLPADKLDEETFRRGYSFLLQATAADIMNTRGLRLGWELFHGPHAPWRGRGALLLQVHDELLFSCVPPLVVPLIEAITAALGRPVYIAPTEGGDAHPFYPRCTYKIGRAWGQMREWKAINPQEMRAHAKTCR